MTLLTCAAVRRRLPAFYDRELPIRELISIESHLSDCPPCMRDLRDLQSVGHALRLAAAPGPADDWTGLQPGVISRMRAEAHESWTERTRRAFDDWHLVWIGLASTAATAILAISVLSMLYFASPYRRTDSLAATFAVLAAPSGSDLNPARLDYRYLVPSVPENGVVYAALAHQTIEREEAYVPLSAVVTREGWVSGLQRLTSNPSIDLQGVDELIAALGNGRLEPARLEGAPVAVNLVWLVAHTTVKPKNRL